VTIAEISAENILDEMDAALTTNDALHSHLHNEYENGRIMKLLLKLGIHLLHY
jgi:Pan3 Pseudokinase domain